MASTGLGAFNRYKQKIVSLTQQGSDPEAALQQSENIMLALFEAIFDEIHENGQAVGTDSRGDTHALTIE